MFAPPVQDLIDELAKLPGIGRKTAQRLAFHLLKIDAAAAKKLASSIVVMKDTVRFCPKCFNFAAGNLCEYCSDPRRDDAIVCVVEEAPDIVSIEKTGEFRGRYHVLGGAISPIDGIGPDDLHLQELLTRISSDGVREVIVATNPNVEGEATAMYLARLLVPVGVKVTRIASGLPVGGDLEYADEVTLGRALQGRRELGV
ncbi:MAG TPA: recombination mediator RecR [Actinomycetota bacterium]|jgi:recombination protein RecR|nr:recombination mediator RecR [Actinomycetota bacterium]